MTGPPTPRAGVRRGTTASATYEVEWTAPAADSGPVTFYAAGNAANNNGAPVGDAIYTANLAVEPAAPAAGGSLPTFRSEDVREALTGRAGLAPGTWIHITGTQLAAKEEPGRPPLAAPCPPPSAASR